MYGINKKDMAVKALQPKEKANIKIIANIEVGMMKIIGYDVQTKLNYILIIGHKKNRTGKSIDDNSLYRKFYQF